jgi:hypothetical protein
VSIEVALLTYRAASPGSSGRVAFPEITRSPPPA